MQNMIVENVLYFQCKIKLPLHTIMAANLLQIVPVPLLLEVADAQATFGGSVGKFFELSQISLIELHIT